METTTPNLSEHTTRIATALVSHEENYQAASLGLDVVVQAYADTDEPDQESETGIGEFWRYLEQQGAVRVNHEKQDGFMTRVNPVGSVFSFRQEYSIKLLNIRPIQLLLPQGGVSYEPDRAVLRLNGGQVRIRPNTNQAALLAALFGASKAPGEAWNADEMLAEFGIREDDQHALDWRKVYTAATSVNTRVAALSGTPDLLLVTKYTVRLNPALTTKS